MKIFILTKTNPFFESSASANRWLTLIIGLQQLKVEIELIITGGYVSLDEYSRLGKKGIYSGVRYLYAVSLFNHNIWLRRINNYICNFILKKRVFSTVFNSLSLNPNSIVWTDTSYESFKIIVNLKSKISNLTTFIELNEFIDIHKINKGNIFQKLKGNSRQAYFEKVACFYYDGIALMTKTLFNYYSSINLDAKLLHLPMTVDFDRFNNVEGTLAGFEKPYIAFVGVMNDAKEGVSILIESFSRLLSDFPEYKLYLIGGWHYDTPNHIQLIKKYGLEDKIILKGLIDRNQIPKIISNASLLVLPRPNSKQAEGGFPTKLGEYLATGIPVCASKVGEIPEYLVDEESIYFAKPGSIDSFSEAMKRALINPKKSKIVGFNGRRVAELYFNKDIQSQILFEFLNRNFKDGN